MNTLKATFIISPDNESYTQTGFWTAIEKLSKKYNVMSEEVPNSRKDAGFGLEANFNLQGDDPDIENFIEELPEWAEQFSSH